VDLYPEPSLQNTVELNFKNAQVTSSPNSLDVPVRFSIPRWGMYETNEGIKTRLAAACAAEGLSAVDKQYLADLEAVAKFCYHYPVSGNMTGDELEAAIGRLQAIWGKDEQEDTA
jgi:hypothetical protein